MAKSDREIISINPATGQEIARVQQSTTDEIASAVAAARRCFSSQWSRTSFSNRRQLLLRARGIILEEMDSIAKLISAESGKPFGEAIAMEIVPVLDLMRWVASDAGKILRPRKIRIGLYALLGRSSRIEYKPLGVIGIIPAWNYPFSIPLGEAAMALMAGNTVVIKPSELTPLVGMKIGEIFSRAGFPADAVKIVSGGGGVGSGLVNAAPDKILFTGSVATGKKILAAAAEKMIPVVLELGGKDPMIVFEDANLEQAAAAAVWGAFCNAGQSCSSVERLYVHESIAEELTKKIVEKTRLLKQGDPLLEEVSIGAISSERQVSVVERHVDDFREAGAVIRTGGRRNPNFANAETNLFYEPTVITGATNEMRPMQEETFGPTLPIATFRDEAEAIRLANDSEFGLTASVWTRDRSRGRRVARQIEAGTVCINEVLYTHGIGQTPWGGVKNSGRGWTHGVEGFFELVRPQHIHTNHLAILPDAWWMPYSPVAVETFRGFARKFASGSLLRTATLLPQLIRRIREIL